MARQIKNKDINLIAAMDRTRQAAKAQKATAIRLPVLVLIAVIVALGGAYYIFYTSTNELETEKELFSLYLNDPTTQADFEASLRAQEEAVRMVAQKDELAQTLLNLSSYPDMTGGDFHLIYEYAGKSVGVSGVSYDRMTGVLSFNAECRTVTGVPIFIAQLRMSGIFADIGYEGYSEQVTTYSTPVEDTEGWLVDADGHPLYETNTDGSFRLDENGNKIQQWGWIKHPPVVTKSTSYIFAVTALVKAPEAHLPYPGEDVNGGQTEETED